MDETLKTVLRTKKKSRFSLGAVSLQLVMTIIALLYAAPIWIVINYSFKTKKELYLGNPLALPQHFSLDNYKIAFKKLNLVTTYFNTFIYTLLSVCILALLCGAAAWAIARCKRRFFKFSFIYFLVGILIPYQALFLPIFLIGYKAHLINTRPGVILIYVATGISFGIFLMNSFISTIPIDLEESARIDGCSIYGTYFKIVLPLLKPAMATLIIMQAFQIWNDYLMASLYVTSKPLKTLTVAMQQLFSQQASDYTTALAAVVLSVLPIAILFIAMQKNYIKGMTAGAVKG